MINWDDKNRDSVFSVTEESEKTRVFEHLELLGFAICAITLGCLALVHSINGHIRWSDLDSLIYMTSLFAFLYAISRLGYSRIAIIIQTVATISFATQLIHEWEGIHSPYPILYAVIILFSATFLGGRAMVYVTIVSALAYSFMMIGGYFQIFTPPKKLNESELLITSLATYIVSFIAVALLARALSTLIKKRGEAVAVSEERYRELVENAPDIILSFDMQGRVVEANRRATEVLGYTREELIGMMGTQLTPPDDLPILTAYFRSLRKTGTPKMIEINLADKTGHIIPVEVNHSVRMENGKASHLRAVVRDISDRKRDQAEHDKLRERLLMTEKMAGLGQLVLGISHEYNNILAGMRALAEIAGLPGKKEKLDKLPENTIQLIDRAQEITRGLLGFAKRFEPNMAEVNVMDIVNEVLDLAAHAINNSDITVEKTIPPDLIVRTEGGKLQEVLLNLVINATHAMEKGGTLKLAAESDGKNVKISVADTGVGIPKENLKRIFEPFFTTKGSIGGSETPGTGLGLSLSYGIIQSLGGEIFVESEENVGSTFTVFLPIRNIDENVNRDKENSGDGDDRRKDKPNHRILVIEDEPAIRETLIEFFTAHKLFAVGAEDGAEGLKYVKSDRFDVAFVDLLMPHMKGEEFVAKAHESNPDLMFVIITGLEFAQEEDEQRINNLPNLIGILKKPFPFEEALEILKMV